MRFPDEVVPLLAELPRELTRLVGTNLFGIYIYGSVLEPTFHRTRSDVDAIVVTNQALHDGDVLSLADWFADRAAANPWFGKLQVSFLIKDTVLADDPRACLYQFGHLARTGSDGNPIVWLDCMQRGATLLGPPPETFVPDITPALLHDALVREVGYLQTELSLKPKSKWRDKPSYRVYATLTLCRILYTNRTGVITSKKAAAEWVLRNVASAYHGLVRSALSDDGSREAHLPLSELRAFVEYVRSALSATNSEDGD